MEAFSKMNRISPISDYREKGLVIDSIVKYSSNTPILSWQGIEKNHRGNKNYPVNICFTDESKIKNKMWFVIEFPQNRFESFVKKLTRKNYNPPIGLGYFFYKNMETKTVDLLFSVMSLDGNEHQVLYKDCKYFGIYSDNIKIVNKSFITKYKKESKFMVSNDWQDKSIDTGVNMYNKEFIDFHNIIIYINKFIQNSINEFHSTEIPHAFPLLKTIKRRNCFRSNHNHIIFQRVIDENDQENELIHAEACTVVDNIVFIDDENPIEIYAEPL